MCRKVARQSIQNQTSKPHERRMEENSLQTRSLKPSEGKFSSLKKSSSLKHLSMWGNKGRKTPRGKKRRNSTLGIKGWKHARSNFSRKEGKYARKVRTSSEKLHFFRRSRRRESLGLGIPPEMGFWRPVKVRCLLPLPPPPKKGPHSPFHIESNFPPLPSPLSSHSGFVVKFVKKRGEDGGWRRAKGTLSLDALSLTQKKWKSPPLIYFEGGEGRRRDSGQQYQHISNFAFPFLFACAPISRKKYKKGNSLGRVKKEGAFGGLVRDTICACLSSHRSRPEKHRRARNSTYCPFSHKIETKKKTKKDDIKKWGDECMCVAEE